MRIKTKIKQDFLKNYETKLEIAKVTENLELKPKTIKSFSFTYACCLVLIISVMGVLVGATAVANKIDTKYSSSINDIVEIEKINEYYQLISNYETNSIKEPGKWIISISQGTMVEEDKHKTVFFIEIDLLDSKYAYSGLIIESRSLDYQKYFSISAKKTILLIVDTDKIVENTCAYFTIFQGNDKFTIRYNL